MFVCVCVRVCVFEFVWRGPQRLLGGPKRLLEGPQNYLGYPRGGGTKKDRKKKKSIPICDGSIDHRPLLGRCPKQNKNRKRSKR